MGQVQLFDTLGNTLLDTKPRSPGSLGPDFYSYRTWADSAFYTPPVFARPSLMARRDIVAATYGGKVYRWRMGLQGQIPTATAVAGWHPKTGTNVTPTSQTEAGTTLNYPIACADVDNNGADEILAATGYIINHYRGIRSGRVYCWRPDGSPKWKYPADSEPFKDDFTSGLAVGRLRGATGPLSVVVGDAAGKVHIIHLSEDGAIGVRPDGAPDVMEIDTLHHPDFPHSATMLNGYPFDSIVAQPVIGDVDGDGIQEVLVGGFDGYVNALKANGPDVSVVWRVAMPLYNAPSSTPFTGHTNLPYPGPHHLTVTGLALSSLKNDGHLNVVATCGVLVVNSAPDYPRNGQMLILDCGPNTYNASALDWPQYQQNAQRTGFLP